MSRQLYCHELVPLPAVFDTKAILWFGAGKLQTSEMSHGAVQPPIKPLTLYSGALLPHDCFIYVQQKRDAMEGVGSMQMPYEVPKEKKVV